MNLTGAACFALVVLQLIEKEVLISKTGLTANVLM
jgi:hypothetical protein